MEFKVLSYDELEQLNYKDCFGIGCQNIEDGYIILDKNRHIIYIESHDNEDIESKLVDKALLYAHNDMIAYCGNKDNLLSKGFVFENDLYIYRRHLYHFKNYDEVHEFISMQKDRVYSLDNFKNYMNVFCNPQHLLKCIHVGGTNGKGSTVNYIRSVLQHASYRVGTFTSPALVNRREVIRINNVPISEEDIVDIANRYMDEWLKYEISMFEIEMFISIIYFIENNIDFVIYEVGLGGELDATNVIHSLISVITNIGLDHTEYLGDSYESIAKTKAGIIKDCSVFITHEDKEQCLNIFKDICSLKNTMFIQANKPRNVELKKILTFDYKDYHVRLNTLALYQAHNCSLAIEVLETLRLKGIVDFSNELMLEALEYASWPGRFEIVHYNPLMIIDGAHNEAGMKAFIESIKEIKHAKVIFSALKDKDTDKMIELLLSVCNDVTICEFDFYRAQKAELLAKDYLVKIEKDWKKAIDESYGYNGTVFITGSLYFIAQVREYILNKK